MCRIDYADDCYGFWREDPHEVTSRKEHQCGDCGRTIAKGERYTRGVWLSTDDKCHTAVHMCQQCVAAGAWLRKVCGGHFWPGVIEELEEHWGEEPDYRCYALGRLVAYGRRRWTLRDGTLVTLDAVERWVTTALEFTPHGRAA